MILNSYNRRQLGVIYDGGSMVRSNNRFYAMHPVVISGTPSEGGTPTLTADTSQTFYAWNNGNIPAAPNAGDYYVCFLNEWGYWFCENTHTHAPGGVTVPNCPCTTTPSVVTMSVTNPSLNSGIFQNATLTYGSTPSWASSLSIGANCHMSPLSYTDTITGDTFAYLLTCATSHYNLTRIYEFSAYGDPFRDVNRYQWTGGVGANSCSPWSFPDGSIFSGGNPATVVTLTG